MREQSQFECEWFGFLAVQVIVLNSLVY
jgi:hypothetical protein